MTAPECRETVAVDRGAVRTAVGLAAVGASLIAVCYGLARFAYGLFVPAFRAEFGLDAATAGLIASGSYVGYCVAVVVATAATVRWGARAVAVAAGVVATLGTATVAAAPDATVLAVGVLVAGSSTGLASPPLAQAIARTVEAAREPRVQTVVNAGTGLGVTVSGPIALVATGQWRLAWLVFALVAAAVTVWTWVAVPTTTRSSDPSATRTADGGGAGLPAGTTALLVGAATMGAASAAVWTFGRDLLAAAGGADLVGTLVWIVLGAAGLLGAFAGDVTTRIGLARAWSGAMVLLGAATAGLALGADHPAAAMVAGAVFGAVYIGLTGLLLLWGARVFAARPVTGIGAAFLVIALGQALGSPLLGLLAGGLSLPGAFLVAALVAVVGAAVRPGPATARP